jgi:hypothetical protein
MVDAPAVSVLMPVYNGEKYLKKAIESVLHQSFADFEFIVVDDGSNDGTANILASYQGRDDRIQVLHQSNQGLVAALNTGLSLARGKYVARMDADDIAMPERLAEQVAALDQNSDVGILGTGCRLIDAADRAVGARYWAESDLQIRWMCLLESPFGHPTVMMRRDVLLRNGLRYREAFHAVEDYDLWTRILGRTRAANLSKPLLQYRIHTESVTNRHRSLQLEQHDSIALRTVRQQLPDFAVSAEQVSQMRARFVGGQEWMLGVAVPLAELGELYLDMLGAFERRYLGEPGMDAVQRQAVMVVAKTLSIAARRTGGRGGGWGHIVRRLMALEPGLPLLLGGRVLQRTMSAVAGRVGKRVDHESE